MKKILIWNTFPLCNTGGPSGYNYNIREYVKVHPEVSIDFLSDVVDAEIHTNPPIKVKEEHLSLPSRVLESLKYRTGVLRNFIKGSFTTPFTEIPTGFDINRYDIVHLHFSMHTRRFRNTFPDFKGKIIVTSHQPCATVDELLQTTSYPWLRYFRHKALLEEARSYDAADHIMFPCRQARETYEKNRELKEAFARNESKFFYVPSAVTNQQVDETRMQRFSELGIPSGSFVITYFGRHNSVKGYDILKQIGERLLDKYPELHILCAGKGDIPPLTHPRWHELGFISNVNELLWQSNLYVLPNRDTYFDLITLEILRSATPLILSTTGGNRYFQTLPAGETEGLDFFDITDIDSLTQKVENHIRLFRADPAAYNIAANKNRKLFLKRFTVEVFMKNYLEAIERL